jgi:hypothetical protein
MQMQVNSNVIGFDDKPLEIEGQQIKIGQIIIEALLASKLKSPVEKKAIWQTIKLVDSAIKNDAAITIPSQETLTNITDHIWEHFPLIVAGSAIDSIERLIQ